MPKKKLTKAQATRKLATCFRLIYDLMVDKIGHHDSNVSMSISKLIDLQKQIKTAMVRTSK